MSQVVLEKIVKSVILFCDGGDGDGGDSDTLHFASNVKVISVKLSSVASIVAKLCEVSTS